MWQLILIKFNHFKTLRGKIGISCSWCGFIKRYQIAVLCIEYCNVTLPILQFTYYFNFFCSRSSFMKRYQIAILCIEYCNVTTTILQFILYFLEDRQSRYIWRIFQMWINFKFSEMTKMSTLAISNKVDRNLHSIHEI